MSTKHTPGPWIAEIANHNSPYAIQFWIIRNENSPGFRDAIAHLPTCAGKIKDHDEANARLIAAAPDLLEALEKSYEWIKQAVDDYGGCDHEVGICACDDRLFLREIETLVAKAKGESHE